MNKQLLLETIVNVTSQLAKISEPLNEAQRLTFSVEAVIQLTVKECARTLTDAGMQSGGVGTIVGQTYLDGSKLVREEYHLDTFGIY